MIRASIVVLCLLFSVATASAECAWVLWEHVWYTGAKSYVPGFGETWVPTGAVATQAKCDGGRISFEAQYQALAKIAPRPDPDKSVQWVCFPDTVDPRGPKGGR